MTKYYLSTIATDAVRIAKAYGLGLEIAEYCTAWNMNEKFTGVDGVVKMKREELEQQKSYLSIEITKAINNTSGWGETQ